MSQQKLSDSDEPDVSRPTTLVEAIARNLEEQRLTEEALRQRYERELGLIKSIKRRDDEIEKSLAQLAKCRQDLKQATKRLEVLEGRYQALSSSKLGSLQRRWWRFRAKGKNSKMISAEGA